MRFREQLIIINQNIDDLKVEIEQSQTLGVNYTHVTNTKSLSRAIQNIASIGFLEVEIQSFIDLGSSINPISNYQMGKDDTVTFIALIEQIKAKTEAVKSSIEISLPKQSENSITIGLPDYTHFKSVGGATEELSKSLSIICSIENYRSEIKIQNFDSGSLWLEIVVGTSATVSFIGFITKIAFSVVAQYRGLKMQKLSLESMEIEISEKDKLYKGIDEIFNYQVRQALENAIESEDKQIDSEDISKLAKAVAILTPLLEQGATFAPASVQSPEIKAEFPTMEAMKSLAPQKLIDTK